MKLLMIRHGEIRSNVNKLYAGKSSERLTKAGLVQANEVAARLKDYEINAVYSSHVYRARQTAEIICQKTGHKPVIDSSFREIELGPWEGKYEDDIARLYPREWGIWQKTPADLYLPGRETLEQLLDRVLSGVSGIVREQKSGIVAIITHVAIIRVLILWKTQKSLNLYKTIHVPNAGIFEIITDGIS